MSYWNFKSSILKWKETLIKEKYTYLLYIQDKLYVFIYVYKCKCVFMYAYVWVYTSVVLCSYICISNTYKDNENQWCISPISVTRQEENEN
jgi:hypothetical protein